jgi:hypothetical protein
MITWMESGLYLYGDGSGWKVDWANRREGEGAGNTQKKIYLIYNTAKV